MTQNPTIEAITFKGKIITPKTLAKKLEVPLEEIIERTKQDLGIFADKVNPDYHMDWSSVQTICQEHGKQAIDKWNDINEILPEAKLTIARLKEFSKFLENPKNHPPRNQTAYLEEAKEHKEAVATLTALVNAIEKTLSNPEIS